MFPCMLSPASCMWGVVPPTGCMRPSTSSSALSSAAWTVLSSQGGQSCMCRPIPRSSRRIPRARLKRRSLARLEVSTPLFAPITSAGWEMLSPSQALIAAPSQSLRGFASVHSPRRAAGHRGLPLTQAWLQLWHAAWWSLPVAWLKLTTTMFPRSVGC